jgi:hypothetical protein
VLEGSLLPTYKVVLEIESDCDVDRMHEVLSGMLNPGPAELKEWSGKVLAVAETQSSRLGNQPSSE